jgi:very-short-patch-repair endonuclease
MKKVKCTKCFSIFEVEEKSKRTRCSTNCAYKRSYSNEQRKNLSIKRKKFLKNNPDKHPWKKSDKFKSVPCENLKKYLINHKIDYIDEYEPLENRFFSIDIAFPQIKVGIEVNGNQHYNADGTLKAYYQQRHNLITAAGWKIIEVHYSQCYNEESIKQILNFKIPYDDQKIIQSILEQRKNKEKIIKIPKVRGLKRKQNNDEKWKLLKDEIFKKNIDFKKFGWVKEVAKVINISPQKIKGWMIRNHKDFYERECFKRKIL